MIRAVIDPSVLVSALIRNAGAAPALVVRAALEVRFTLIACPLLLGELEEVLRRPKFARWSGACRAGAYVAALRLQAELHDDPEEAESAGLRDPKDEYLAALVRFADADALVSVDRDLLEAELADVTVVDPRSFLDRLSS